MTMEYVRAKYEEVKKELLGSRDSGNVWTEHLDRIAESLVGFVQLFSCSSIF